MTDCETNSPVKALRDWQRARLPILRAKPLMPSKYEKDVTLVIYSFPAENAAAQAFQWIECSIRQTWHLLGRLKTVLVVDRPFPEALAFARSEPSVELQIEPSLVPGDIHSMSADCIQRLHRRFTTPHCLIIQDDGFPLRDNLGDFIGKADYWGAPIISDGWKRKLCYGLGLGAFNGGFSLRTRRFCAYAAAMWSRYFHFLKPKCGEDFYYTTLLRLLPRTGFAFKFPNEKAAFAFAFDDLDGHVALPYREIKPFGIHGKSTAAFLLAHMGDLG